MGEVVLASGNQGKLIELQAFLTEKDVELIPQSEFNVSDVAETGLSFVENALIKARHACTETMLPSIADDPLFFVPTHDCTSAELDPETKNSLSHRGQALRQLLQCWKDLP